MSDEKLAYKEKKREFIEREKEELSRKRKEQQQESTLRKEELSEQEKYAEHFMLGVEKKEEAELRTPHPPIVKVEKEFIRLEKAGATPKLERLTEEPPIKLPVISLTFKPLPGAEIEKVYPELRKGEAKQRPKPPTIPVTFKPLTVSKKESSPEPREGELAKQRVKPPIVQIKNIKLPVKSVENITFRIKAIERKTPTTIKIPSISLPKETQKVTPKPVEKGESFSSAGTPETEELVLPDFLKKLGGIAKPLSRPVCIILPKLVNESHVHSVAIICREIYRIVKGGIPKPRWLSEGSKEEIEECMRAGDMIFVVDDSKCKLLPNFSRIEKVSELWERVKESKLFDRLYELFSQEFGFIIFHINEKYVEEFAKILEEKAGFYAKIVKIDPSSLPLKPKEKFAKICWGFVNVKGESFDELFGSAEKNFFELLERIADDVEVKHWIEKDPNASREHENLKVIAVKSIAKVLGAKNRDEILQMLKEKMIRTEFEVGKGRADICIKVNGKKPVEIETFYGTGDPIDKLYETLDKYVDRETSAKYVNQVDVILFGLHALLYTRKLLKLAKVYEREYKLKVNFYLPDLAQENLIHLRSVLRELKQIFSGIQAPIKPLTDKDVERLWFEFSKVINEAGLNPETYRERFEMYLEPSMPYEDNLNVLLDEARKIIAEKMFYKQS